MIDYRLDPVLDTIHRMGYTLSMRYPPVSSPLGPHFAKLTSEEKARFNSFLGKRHKAILYWNDYKNYYPHNGPLSSYQFSRSEFIYFSLYEQGYAANEIAKFTSVSLHCVSQHLKRARGKWTAVHDAIGAGEMFDALAVNRRFMGIK